MPNPNNTSATSATENPPDQSVTVPEEALGQLDTVPEKPKPPPFTAIWQAVLAIMAMLIVETIFSLIIYIICKIIIHIPPKEDVWSNYATGFMAFAVPTAFAVLLLLLSRRPLSSLWGRGRFHVSTLPPILLLVFGVSIISSDIDNVTRYFFPMPEFIKQLLENLNPDPLSGMLLMVVAAPFGEEVFFRGALLGGFLRRYSTRTALLVSALLFALAHVNPYQLASAFIAGIVLGAIYIKTKSLWPCVFAHAANNFLVWMTMNHQMPFSIPGYSSPPSDGLHFQPWWFDILGIALIISAVFALSKMFREPNND